MVLLKPFQQKDRDKELNLIEKQPKCLSTDEWIKTMWYIHTMKYYSSIKKEKMMTVTAI